MENCDTMPSFLVKKKLVETYVKDKTCTSMMGEGLSVKDIIE
jgi:hypothetical protein